MARIHRFYRLEQSLPKRPFPYALDWPAGRRNYGPSSNEFLGCLSLFSLRKISYYLIDLRSAMSLGSSRGYSIAFAMYPTVPRWKSQMEASLRSRALSTSIRGAQTVAAAWWSALLSPSVADLVCIVWGCLAALWCSVSRGGWFFPPSITSFPLSSLFLLWSARSVWRGWVGGGVRSLV